MNTAEIQIKGGTETSSTLFRCPMKGLLQLITFLLIIWALYDDQSFANSVGPIIAKLIRVIIELVKAVQIAL